jgi:peptidoglycan biosynthesis protein MviN/MurJ (putative lipid II flippase)
VRRGFVALLSGNLLGKAVGFARELVLAALFGTGESVVALRVATTGTLVPINFFTSDALSVGFLPHYASIRVREPDRLRVYYRVVERIVLTGGMAAALIIAVASAPWAAVIAPALPSPTLGLASQMLMIMALGAPFYVYSNLASFVEMGEGSYLLASARPTVQSLGLIAGTVLAYVCGDPLVLAWGFSTAYIAFSGFCYVRLRAVAPSVVARGPLAKEDVKWATARFLRTLAPVIWLPFVSQGAWIAERAIASVSTSEAVAALDYARNVTDTGYVLVSAPIGLVVLSAFANLERTELVGRTSRLVRQILLLAVPMSLALWIGSRLAVEILYQRGAFDAGSAEVTCSILSGLALGLWAQTLAYSLMKVLNASRRNLAASGTLVLGVAVWIASDLALVPRFGPAGLGLGWAAGSVAQLVGSAVALGVLRPIGRAMGLCLPMVVLGVAAHALMDARLLSDWLAVSLFLASSAAYVLAHPGLRTEASALLRRH